MRFDPALVKKEIMNIVPEGYEQKRLTEGRFVIDTRWRNGILKKTMLDNEDITHKTDSAEVAQSIVTILKTASKFRFKFTGKIAFFVTISGGAIDSIYWDSGNFILKNAANRKQTN